MVAGTLGQFLCFVTELGCSSTQHILQKGTQLPQLPVTFRDATKPPTPFPLGGPGSSQNVPELKFISCSSSLTGFS